MIYKLVYQNKPLRNEQVVVVTLKPKYTPTAEKSSVIQIITKAYEDSYLRIITALFKILTNVDKIMTHKVKLSWKKNLT